MIATAQFLNLFVKRAGLGWATTAQINNIKTILIGVVLF
jgi:hypothetical protein